MLTLKTQPGSLSASILSIFRRVSYLFYFGHFGHLYIFDTILNDIARYNKQIVDHEVGQRLVILVTVLVIFGQRIFCRFAIVVYRSVSLYIFL